MGRPGRGRSRAARAPTSDLGRAAPTRPRRGRSWIVPRNGLACWSVRAFRRFTVRPVLPEPLGALAALAGNLRWSWHPPTQDVFSSIDPELWRQVKRDPVRLLGAVGRERLDELVEDGDFRARLGAAHADLQRYLTEDRWYARKAGDDAPRAIAYFSSEFGITVGAAAVLRRPRHPGRRPPQGVLRPRHPAGGRRPVLPPRLLQAGARPRRLAAGELPRPRPRRAAADRAPRARRQPSDGLHRPPRRPRPGGPDPRRPRRSRAAAAPRHRHRGEQRPLPRRDRPALRRQLRAPAAPGAAPRRGRRTRPAGVVAHHRRPGARGLPRQRGSRRLPRHRAHP